jgi:SprT protein
VARSHGLFDGNHGKIKTKGMKEKEILAKYLPALAVNPVYHWIIRYNIHLQITRSRRTKLGDYRPPAASKPYHRITVNHDLNPYAFFITFVHELAHLLTYKQYGPRVKAHGREWKSHYRKLLEPFLEQNIFPHELKNSVYSHLQNIKASSGGDIQLTRTLMLFDENPQETRMENLQPGDIFLYQDSRKFQVITKLRKRYKCLEIATERVFLFQPLTPVEKVDTEKKFSGNRN